MKLLTTLLLLAVLVKSCDDKSSLPIESYDTIYIDVKQGEVTDYYTSLDNYMGSVEIKDSTKYHALSELYLAPNGPSVYHRYQPLKNYSGNDTLKLRKETINDTSDEIISIKNITIVLTIK